MLKNITMTRLILYKRSKFNRCFSLSLNLSINLTKVQNFNQSLTEDDKILPRLKYLSEVEILGQSMVKYLKLS